MKRILTAIVALAAASCAPKADYTIVADEFIYEDGVTPSCHASTIEELPDGTLIAAWFGGTKESADDVDIWSSSKEKGGVWSAPEVIARDSLHACWNPVLFLAQDGTLLFFYKTGPKVKEWKGHLKSSLDGGLTWSADSTFQEGMFGAIKDKPVQLEGGRIIAPSSDERDGWKIHFEISDDGGANWRKVGPIAADDSVGVIQPSILRLSDGRLEALCRSTNGHIAATFSEDSGDSWSRVTLTDLPNNNSGLDALTLGDGRHLLVCNNTGNRPGEHKGDRTPLSVLLSRDGQSWEVLCDLETEPGEYSYPAVIQGKDGTVHITYTWNRTHIRHVAMKIGGK